MRDVKKKTNVRTSHAHCFQKTNFNTTPEFPYFLTDTHNNSFDTHNKTSD